MATLRETIQAKIQATETELQQAKDDLAKLENEASSFLGFEAETVKSWFSTVAKHLGL